MEQNFVRKMREIISEIRIAWRCLGRALELEVLRWLPLLWLIRWVRFEAPLRCWKGIRKRQKQLRVLFPGVAADKIRMWAREGLINSRLRECLNSLLWRHDARDFSDRIVVEGWPHLEAALRQGKGAILLATHLGLPRVLRWYLRSTNFCVYYLVRIGFPRKQGVEQWFIDRLRLRHGVDTEGVIGDGDLSLQWSKKVYDALRRNELVYMTGDGGIGGQKIRVPICGKVTSISTGGFSIGMLAGAAILPCFTHLDSREQRFYIQIQAPLPAPPQSMSKVQRLHVFATNYAARVESYIANNPRHVWDEYLPNDL